MSRELSNTWVNALDDRQFRLATLIKITDLGASPILLTDYGSQISYLAQTYLSNGAVLEIGDVKETGSLKVNELTITLTGSDPQQTYIAAFLNNSPTKATILIRRALMNANGSVADVFTFFSGKITSYNIADSGFESGIAITCASHWADFDKVRCRRTNLKSQQSFFPDDLGMKYAHVQTKDLRWGRSG
jgi:hypothetical protein